ncbi:MAG: ATP-binding protein [Magnetococcales bacterium]|nr:ATP-binding protein [Magnetococcales bacterium]
MTSQDPTTPSFDFFSRFGREAGKIFVGRQGELAAVESALGDRKHLLFIGPRGVGKTYFTHRCAENYRQAPAHNQRRVIPIRLDEDFRDFSDITQFILDVYQKFGEGIAEFEPRRSTAIAGKSTRREGELGAVAAIRDMMREEGWTHRKLIDTVTQGILGSREELGFPPKNTPEYRIAVFVENLDLFIERILSNRKEDIEHFLLFLDKAQITLIATSTTHPKLLKDQNSLFHQQFEVRPIQEFSVAESREFLERLADSRNDVSFRQDLGQNPIILDMIHPFTNGNARMLAMFYKALRGQKKGEIEKAIADLLVDLTPYYQDRLKQHGLVGLRHEVLIQMVKNQAPVSQKAIANQLKRNKNSIRSAMSWLVEHHYAKPHGDKGKEQKYVIKYTMFRMWMEVRQSMDSFNRISALIQFFQSFYGGEEASREYTHRLGDMSFRGTALEDNKALMNLFDMERYSSLDPEYVKKAREYVANNDPEGMRSLHNGFRGGAAFGPDPEGNFNLFNALCLFMVRDFHEANALFQELFQKDQVQADPIWWVYSRSLFLAQESLGTIEKFNDKWRKAKPETREPIYHQGVILLLQRRYTEAATAFDQAIDAPAQEWGVRKPVILGNKGQALLLNDQPEAALACCEEALAQKGGNDIPQIHRNLVAIHLRLNNPQAAHKHLQATIACLEQPQDSRNLDMDLGTLFDAIDDDSPLADDGVRLVVAFIQATRINLNRTRIQRLLNNLISQSKLGIAQKMIDALKNDPGKLSEQFLPYIHAFEIHRKESIKERNVYKKNLLPEYREAVEIILQLVSSAG